MVLCAINLIIATLSVRRKRKVNATNGYDCHTIITEHMISQHPGPAAGEILNSQFRKFRVEGGP